MRVLIADDGPVEGWPVLYPPGVEERTKIGMLLEQGGSATLCSVNVPGEWRKGHYDEEPQSTPQLLLDLRFGTLKDRSLLCSKDIALQVSTEDCWTLQWTQELAPDEFHRPHRPSGNLTDTHLNTIEYFSDQDAQDIARVWFRI